MPPFARHPGFQAKGGEPACWKFQLSFVLSFLGLPWLYYITWHWLSMEPLMVPPRLSVLWELSRDSHSACFRLKFQIRTSGGEFLCSLVQEVGQGECWWTAWCWKTGKNRGQQEEGWLSWGPWQMLQQVLNSMLCLSAPLHPRQASIITLTLGMKGISLKLLTD